MKILSIATAALFVGGCLCAQQSSQSTTTTTTTVAPVNMEGTLIDQGCVTSHTHSRETTTNPDSTTTTTTETTKYNSECPATTSTTSFALMTPEGRMIHFDPASNSRVVGVLRTDRTFTNDMQEHRPVKVRIVATPDGNVMIIKNIKAYQ